MNFYKIIAKSKKCYILGEPLSTYFKRVLETNLEVKATQPSCEFIFSNEKDVDLTLDKIAKSRKIVSFMSEPKFRIAFLVGESSILSSLPEISRHCNLIVINDLNPNVLSHVEFQVMLLRTCENRSAFETQYFSNQNPIYKKKFQNNRKTLYEAFNDRKTHLGKKHFLASEKRYQECRSALSQLDISITSIDMFSKEEIQELAQALTTNKAIISILNVTNLYEYDISYPRKSDIEFTVRKLTCYAGGAFIMYSVLASNNPVCESFKSYVSRYPHDYLIANGHDEM
jgi:hypothetical protein